MKKLLLTIWEAPQKLAALLAKKIFKAEECGEYNGAKLYFWRCEGGMSLSNHIFLPFNELTGSQWQEEYIKHEYGHTIQSRYLGPFYLLIIGIPSLLWAGWYGIIEKKTKKSYYWFYTESWADKLGGVKRED